MKHGRSGFSLIELLVVVAIIGVLAMIAITSYQSYRTRSYQSNAISALQKVRLAMEAYRTKQNGYLAAGENVTLLPGVTSNLSEGPSGKQYELSVTGASSTGFVIQARCEVGSGCNLDSDPSADEWTINHLGTITRTIDDVSN